MSRHTQAKSSLLPDVYGGAFPLSLALPRLLPGARYQPLFSAMPFLALNRRPAGRQPISAQAHTQLAAMPWNTPGPSGWTAEAPALAGPSPAIRSPAAVKRDGPAHQGPGATEIHLEILAALSPILHRVVQQQNQAQRGSGSSGHRPTGLAPRGYLPLPQINLTHVNMVSRARPGPATPPALTAMAVWPMAQATPMPQKATGADERVPNAPLSATAVRGSPHSPDAAAIRSGVTSPRPFVFREDTPLPPTRPAQGGQSPLGAGHANAGRSQWGLPPSAAAQPEPLIWRRTDAHAQAETLVADGDLVSIGRAQDARGTPGPYGPSPLSQLVSLQETLVHGIKRQVTVEVERQCREIERVLSRQVRTLQVTPPGPAENVSDAMVQTLLQKMRALLQEERFRQGFIR